MWSPRLSTGRPIRTIFNNYAFQIRTEDLERTILIRAPYDLLCQYCNVFNGFNANKKALNNILQSPTSKHLANTQFCTESL